MTHSPTPDPSATQRAADLSGYQRSDDPVYAVLAAGDDFAELRRRQRRFAVPATVAFLSWYLLYVVLSNWASGFMGHQLLGNINVALVFGLLQFVSTFVLAYVYSGYSTRRLDPLAHQLDEQYEHEKQA